MIWVNAMILEIWTCFEWYNQAMSNPSYGNEFIDCGVRFCKYNNLLWYTTILRLGTW